VTLLECSAYNGCTTIMVGRKATADGSIMVGHNEDMRADPGVLCHFPRQVHREKEVRVRFATIPQVPETHAYWQSGCSEPTANSLHGGGWALPGMNEFGVSVCCNTTYTREDVPPMGTDGTIDLLFQMKTLILERARTAREGVDITTELIERYGGCSGLVDITIADSNEVWLLETTSRHWVARRIPDSGHHIMANQYTIHTEWDMASRDLVDYATSKGWYDPTTEQPFSFKHTYGVNLDNPSNVSREFQGQYMLTEKTGRITIKDVLTILTQPPIQSIDTQSFEVFHLRGGMPAEIGCVMWFGMSSGTTSVIVPVYAGASRVAKEYTVAGLEYDLDSAWWQFKRIQQGLYPRIWEHTDDYPRIRRRLDRLQKEVFEKTADVEEKAGELLAQGKTNQAKGLLTNHTYSQLKAALRLARRIVDSIT